MNVTANRKPTIKDIAAALGISHSTVSRALGDSPLIGADTKQRVSDAARQIGYVRNSAARIMRGDASGVIGLLVPDVQTDFFSSLVKHFSKAASEAGLSLLLSVSGHDPVAEQRLLRAFREAHVAGIAIFPTKHLTQASQALLEPVRMVQVGRSHASLRAPYVGSDDAASMAALVQHLLQFGHRRIAFIGSDPAVAPGRRRWLAFRHALGPVPAPMRQVGEPSAEGGRQCMQALLALAGRPTAIVVASAPMMLGVVEAAQAAGVAAPRDFSLAGFGDPEWFRVFVPGITAVALPTRLIAETALQILIASPEQDRRETLLPNHIVLRGTVGKPSAVSQIITRP